MFYYDLSLSG